MATVEAPCVTGVSVKTKTATKTKSPESGQPVLGFTTKSRMKNVKVFVLCVVDATACILAALNCVVFQKLLF